ncbi:MAG TPA: tetratricopeptide repeat protein [Bacteroidia bacterium]|jgi:serine phosphatase RsbU (regulator of sigma subunit)
MKHRSRIFFTVFISLVMVGLVPKKMFADQSEIDSLLGILPKTKDSVKASVLVKISQYYQSRETEKSLDYCKQALELSEKLGNKPLIAGAHYRLGNIYNGQGDYSKAFDELLRAYNIFESIKLYRNMANCANSIGNIYLARKDTVNMFRYYTIALENAERSGDQMTIAVVKVGLGNVYQTKKNFGKAIAYFTEAADIFKGMNAEMQYCVCMANTGSCYLGLSDYAKADATFSEVIPIAEKVGNKYVMALAYAQGGEAKEGLGKYPEAITMLYKGLACAREIMARDNINEIYHYLAEAYSAIHQPDSAYLYMKRSSELRDSIFNEESARQTAEMNAKYETAEKDKALLQKESEAKQNAAQRNTFIIGFALMLLLALFAYRSYVQKKKDTAEIGRQKEIIEEKNKDITDSIRYALNIQGAILPHDDQVTDLLGEHFIFFKPRDIVSGDFYWLHRDGNRTFVGAIDCTGHGVPGALMSIVGHNALKQITSGDAGVKPAEVLNRMQLHLKEMFVNEYTGTGINDGMDAAICCFDRNTMKLEFAGAHNPLWVVRNGVLTEIKGDKRSVSGQESNTASFTHHEIDLREGDAVYLFSDGFADQFGGKDGKKFKYNKFKELVVSVSGKPMNEQKEHLFVTLEEWKGPLEQIDDVMVIGFRI